MNKNLKLSKVLELSKEMKAFLQDWLAWAGGAESIINYPSQEGLCIAASRWEARHHLPRYTLVKELKECFLACGLAPNFPFGTERYKEYSWIGMHGDENRVMWVRTALRLPLQGWKKSYPLVELPGKKPWWKFW